MKKILVWDLPIRFFHWGFAFSVSAALGIAFLVDDDSPFFQWHMLLGLAALFLLGLRLLLGLGGSRHARFSSYPLHPREVLAYFAAAMVARTKPYAGNNPGSALAAVLMFILVPALAITGTDWTGTIREDAHEIAAWALLGVIGLHLLGLVWHTLRHRENIAASMITGRKSGEEADGISSAHVVPGLVMLVACGAWIGVLFKNHQAGAASVRLPLTGINVSLGEKEKAEGDRRKGGGKHDGNAHHRSHSHKEDD